ncbi:MAG TPA: DUF3887 domain-containing protein [Candidatus Angelobacter sp.]
MLLPLRRWIIATLLLTAVAACAKTVDLNSRAKTLVVNFMAQKFDKVESQFDSAARSEWPTSKLQGVWYTLKAQLGDFQSIEKTRREDLPNYQVIVVTCRFVGITWDIRVAFDAQGRVGGLFFTPPKTQVTATEQTSCSAETSCEL